MGAPYCVIKKVVPLHFKITWVMRTAKNRFNFIFLAAIAFLSTVSSAQIIGDTTGTLTWSLDLTDSTLTISGSGTMPNYNYSNYLVPWDSCRNAIKTVVIGDSVTSIGDFAFYQCSNLKLITISDSVASIGIWAFAFCDSLTSIVVPDGVASIGTYIFYVCSNLVSVKLSDNIARIEDNAFYQCENLTSVNIPNKVAWIGNSAFQYCGKLTSISFPDGLDSIGDFAFSDCISLTSITIPANVVSLGSKYVFGFCSNLREINVNSNNNAYASEDGVLFNKSKTRLIQYPAGKTSTYYTLPNSVTDIGTSAFRSCVRLTVVTIPNSVINIEQQAFSGCLSLQSATIGNSVADIGYAAFSSSGLKNIFSLNENPPATAPDNSTFADVNKNVCILHVPVGSKNKYIAADSWKDFLIIEEDITNIFTHSELPLPIYPNPTTGMVYFPTESNIRIYTIMGKLLQETFGKEVDLSAYPQGMYFLRTENAWTKVIKE